MTAISIIMAVIAVFTTLFGLYFAAIAISGTLRSNVKNPYSAPQKRIAAIIAARNEEKVIAPLVESIVRQKYPKELIEVFVLPNNCTDGTEAAAKSAGATILSCDIDIHSKGEALKWAFNHLLKARADIDAYLIIDADNLLDENYYQAVNNALCAGAKVAQGYRDSKNYSDNWVAGCTSEFYWCMNRFYNRARNALGISCALNGTGILISADYLRRHGYETTSLTEDLEYTAQCALNGERIWWMDDAIAYDEQPTSLKDSFKQRRRWSAGIVQCMKMYFMPLAKRAIKCRSLQCMDEAILFTGPLTQLLCLFPGVYTFARNMLDPDMPSPIVQLAVLGGVRACGDIGAFARIICHTTR